MRRWTWMLLWLLGPALAQEVRPVNSVEEVVRLIGQAQQQIVLVAPGLFNTPIATALHQAAVQRGVQVLLLLEAGHINQPASFGAAFSFLAPERPLHVRVVQVVRLEPRLLLDSRVLLSGPLVAGESFSPRPTWASTKRTDLEVEIERFNRVWRQAPPCRPSAMMAGEQFILRCRF